MVAAEIPRLVGSPGIFMLACLGWGFVGSLLTAAADRKDVKNYNKTYFWVELADGLYISAGIGMLMPTVGCLFLLGERESGEPAGTVGLVVLAVVGAVCAALGVWTFNHSSRVLVPGMLAGGSAGVCVLAAAGLLGFHQLDLVDTAVLGWLPGVGAGLVIMFFMLILANPGI
jgi:hypothetical protein